MRIVMITNLYTPVVSGVARSIEQFVEQYRNRGHDVLVVSPKFDDQPEEEQDVIRVPALQNFNGSDFSLAAPIPGFLAGKLRKFDPEILHSHHPFLLGSTAVRLSTDLNRPIVYTYHTMYEHYTHYVPVGWNKMRDFVIQLAAGYCNLCDRVIAPSESVKNILRDRNVNAPISAIPTGVEIDRYRQGDGASFRKKRQIPEDAFLVGHVSRLEPEKNVRFLQVAVERFLKENDKARFLLVGQGSLEQEMQSAFQAADLNDRVYVEGVLEGKEIVDAYHAMDLFAFASKTETQGMVLAEAMAAGTPVVALDAPGSREIVQDQENGRLVPKEEASLFTEALNWASGLDAPAWKHLCRKARQTAEDYSMENSVDRVLELYGAMLQEDVVEKQTENSVWEKAMEQVSTEWELFKNAASSLVDNVEVKK